MGGEVVGGSLMMIQPLPLRLGAIAVAKWGPMLARADHPEAGDIYRGMVDALVAELCRQAPDDADVLPRASLTPVNAEYEHLMARGFTRGSELGFPNRYIVNLRLDDAAQRKSFHQKWRYHLNKSEKAGLSFERAPARNCTEFDALYERMIDRKKFADHSAYETVPALMAIADETLRPELFFVRHEGEIVAGAIIFKAGDRAVYLYGATNDKALPLRAGYFLHWHIIRWLRDNTAAKWYDLGGTDGFQGLHQFKKGMVGDAGVISPGAACRQLCGALVAAVCSAMPRSRRATAVNNIKRVDRASARRPGPSRPEARRDGAAPNEPPPTSAVAVDRDLRRPHFRRRADLSRPGCDRPLSGAAGCWANTS